MHVCVFYPYESEDFMLRCSRWERGGSGECRNELRGEGKGADGICVVIYANTCHPSAADPPSFLYSGSFQSPVDTALGSAHRETVASHSVTSDAHYSLGAITFVFNFMNVGGCSAYLHLLGFLICL